jgi:hypothetical protein
MSTVLANPAEMIAHGAPRVIHNDAELETLQQIDENGRLTVRMDGDKGRLVTFSIVPPMVMM